MLPIDTILPDLLDTLEHHTTVLLQAPTGSGKTTRVPLALLEAGWRGDGRILMLEPRRLAARTAARFMAAGLGEEAGATVGYRTRLDTRVSAATRVEVVTEGILTRLIQADPTLSDYAAVIFDEFHERSLSADLGLALARETQQALRQDLRLVVMSATLATESLAALLDDCPVVTAEGRSYPVDVHYRPPDRRRGEHAHAAAVVREAMAEETGSVLVFLPGMREIRRVGERLGAHLPDDARLHLLHGRLDAREQDAAIRPAADGRRKVVLASAVAESSLTIEGIRIVVDAGWQRRARFDPNSGMTRLVTERVSKASAEQRRGRAGRIEPGCCYRLWTEAEQARLQPQAVPEIASADLAPLVLELAQWGVSEPAGMTWLDPPPAPHWDQAVDLLRQLDALDHEARITAHGRALLALGLHPRLANMVLAGRERGLALTAARLAALLSDRTPASGEGVDIQPLLNRFGSWGPGSPGKPIRRTADKLAGGRRDEADADEAAGGLLATAWPDRIGRQRRRQRGRFRLSNGRGAFVDESDPLAGSEFLVACELDGDAREARIYRAARLRRADIESDLSNHIEQREVAEWDDRRGTVVARRQRRLGALVLEETECPRPDPETLQQGLLDAVRRKGIAALPWTPAARQWQARVGLLREHGPGDWPAIDDATLAENLDQWLLPWLAGLARWSDVQSLDLVGVFNSLLDHEQQKDLAALAPTHIDLPGGRRARLDYCTDNAPALSIRLQAMLGCRRTPTIARGRIPVQLQLLSPADRPLAVTTDLASFWDNVYPDVRKDMRGRYPKHDWPEDPG